ncbi:hypothetical protein GRI58_08920 [Porphyrobacter algicida]|uniref:Uncharacterized protein n=1 Tax=Qipengyuania algicida TaxID=1836209 RepID=A0A845AH27_9SPHN|nr:hypothetical protein [Qipengyuania algicida]MXP28944.1 hypothetical protein [Qipengyuania algicida]
MAGSQDTGIGQASSACLFPLFRPGTRPESDAIKQAVDRSGHGFVSHDPRESLSPDDPGEAWLELLVDGVTFDVLGLAPLQSVCWPGLRHHFGIGENDITSCEAIVIGPGPHLSGAASAIPVVRAMMGMAEALLEQIEGAVAVV